MAPRTGWIVRPDEPVPYERANRAMHELAQMRLRAEIPDTLILLEHPPVFTAGRRSRDEELLWTGDEVSARGAEVHKIDRGGSFTFHGPGQLVGYPIIDLGSRPDAEAHMRRIEQAIIGSAADVGVELTRRPDVQTGVWYGDDKVCAIGIRLAKARVSLHGFGLNCDTDLSWFRGIIACGMPDHGVTSLSEISGRTVSVPEMVPLVRHRFGEAFDITWQEAPEPVAEMFAGSVEPARI
jgi:lipoyl(octanoyl) transferase